MSVRFATLACLSLTVALLAPVSLADDPAHPAPVQVWIEGVGGLQLDATLFQPAGASTAAPVPMVLHSHGWGGTKSDSGFDAWLDAGFGVLSFSQRGHGQTGGTSHVMDPDFEGQDVIAVIDFVAGLDWVAKDPADPADPVLGALGGSYGGGYQFVGALTEIRDAGSTRFDVLAPEITWYDLPDSLAPNAVIRSAYVSGLYAAGARMLPQEIHEAYWYGMVTGQLPDGSVPGTTDVVSQLRRNGPVGFVEDQGIQLDVPVLLHQGMTDTLFNLNQAHRNYWHTLTDAARAESYLFGFNGGHQQLYPAFQFPPGTGGSGDPCADLWGGWDALVLAYFSNHLKGASDPLPTAPFHLATTDDTCISTADMAFDGLADATLPDIAVAGAGAPVYVEVAQGPLTVAGVPHLGGWLTATLDQRLFVALAVGATPADAKVLGKAWMPIRSGPTGDHVLGEQVDLEMAGVAATLEAGEKLWLVVAPTVDQFFAHGSRTPGAATLTGVTLDLPLQP